MYGPLSYRQLGRVARGAFLRRSSDPLRRAGFSVAVLAPTEADRHDLPIKRLRRNPIVRPERVRKPQFVEPLEHIAPPAVAVYTAPPAGPVIPRPPRRPVVPILAGMETPLETALRQSAEDQALVLPVLAMLARYSGLGAVRFHIEGKG